MNNKPTYIKYSQSLPKDTNPLMKLASLKLSKNTNKKCHQCIKKRFKKYQ